MSNSEEPASLDKARHIRYWQRCHGTFLPSRYTDYDSTRMTLAFFIISALDLLSPRPDSTPSSDPAQSASDAPKLLSATDRQSIRSWVLSLQHPGGGFVGSPNHILPRAQYLSSTPDRPKNANDANLGATYFALMLLALSVDDEDGAGSGAFAGVDRRNTLLWLRKLQRGDGSFGELVDGEGNVRGGRDMRYCYLAASIRWCLRGDVSEGDGAWVEDIDVEGLLGHIRKAQTYDGGMAESSQHESHAGYAYCAVAALSLLERPLAENPTPPPSALVSGIPSIPALIKFLVGRQLAYIDPPDDEDEEMEDDPDTANAVEVGLGHLALGEGELCVGYNGRWNKAADTCYCWWVGGALKILGHETLINAVPSRRFLLTKTQHLIGGFSKHPGGPPDILHAYMGLAALAVMRDENLREFDAALCVSRNTVGKIERARAEAVSRAKA